MPFCYNTKQNQLLLRKGMYGRNSEGEQEISDIAT